MSSSKSFGERLKAARELKEFSQAQLAKRAGLQPSHVSHFETDRRTPSAENLRALADALSVSTDFLLGRVVRPTLSGPKFDSMIKHAEKLSDGDLDMLNAFAETLAERRRGSDSKD